MSLGLAVKIAESMRSLIVCDSTVKIRRFLLVLGSTIKIPESRFIIFNHIF